MMKCIAPGVADAPWRHHPDSTTTTTAAATTLGAQPHQLQPLQRRLACWEAHPLLVVTVWRGGWGVGWWGVGGGGWWWAVGSGGGVVVVVG